ncbi:MAG: LacI family DNA-binding transcriptional regulator [Bacillota bacterium]
MNFILNIFRACGIVYSINESFERVSEMVSTTEVAKHAGVSQTTVSRVLNRPEQVKKETYDKVMKALAELDYGNANANALNAETVDASNEIAVVFSKDCSPNDFASLLELTVAGQAAGYKVTGHVLTGNESMEELKASMSKATGVLGIGDLPAELEEYLKETSRAFLQAEEAAGEVEPFDGRKAAFLAASHLAKANHQQIAWVGTDLPDSGERLQGYYEALAQHQLKLRKKRIHTIQSPADFDAIAAELRSFKKPTSAFVAATYEDGLQLLDSLESAGFKVPKDISIIAIGQPEEDGSAALTSVKPAAAAEARPHNVLEQLVQHIEGKAPKSQASPEEFQIDNKKTVKKFKARQKNKA